MVDRRVALTTILVVLATNRVPAFVLDQRCHCSATRRGLRRGRRVHCLKAKTSADASDNSSNNFWYTETRKDDNDGVIILPISSSGQQQTEKSGLRIPPLPCVPTLDESGPLPPSIYFRTSPYAKEICRLQVAWDYDDDEPDARVKEMQAFIDACLTTFQLNNPDGQSLTAYGNLIRNTPKSVLDHCHLTVPFSISTPINASSVRTTIANKLSRMNTDSIDDLQVEFAGASPTAYHLDLLDILKELQREGLVRTVSARNLSKSLYQDAEAVDLVNLIESNQIQSHLLRRSTTSLPSLPSIVENPLAGGWLSDRWWRKNQPTPRQWQQQLSSLEREDWRLIEERWKEASVSSSSSSRQTTWHAYQTEILAPIHDIARHNGVSVAAVVLRWTLQDSPSAVVNHSMATLQDFRNVLRFRLEDDDLERLEQIAGRKEIDNQRATEEDLNRVNDTASGLFL